jgi:hypothetical protein
MATNPILNLMEDLMQFANSTTVTNLQEIDTALLENISGGAYFWDDGDFRENTSTSTDVPVTNLIPLPR